MGVSIYQLTAVEARLASELVGGASPAEAATAIGVQLHTARGYLKQIFVKTQTNRQVDLIGLMLTSAARSHAGADLSLLQSRFPRDVAAVFQLHDFACIHFGRSRPDPVEPACRKSTCDSRGGGGHPHSCRRPRWTGLNKGAVPT